MCLNTVSKSCLGLEGRFSKPDANQNFAKFLCVSSVCHMKCMQTAAPPGLRSQHLHDFEPIALPPLGAQRSLHFKLGLITRVNLRAPVLAPFGQPQKGSLVRPKQIRGWVDVQGIDSRQAH